MILPKQTKWHKTNGKQNGGKPLKHEGDCPRGI